jgi:hypothetical protein
MRAAIRRTLTPIYVVDDFYDEPDSVRELALSLEYRQTPARHDYFPGLRSTTRYFTKTHLRRFKALIPSMGFRDRAENGAFQFLPRAASRYFRIHADGLSGWAGVLYLNPDRDGTPGTSFFQHEWLGWTSMPSTRVLGQMPRSARTKLIRRLWNDGADAKKWKEVACVSIRYNRLVLFKRNLFHVNASAFGTTYGNARLVQIFFF